MGTLHITSGDMSGGNLARAGLPGEVFVWHDILYDGPRDPGWPSDDILAQRALFIEHETGGGLTRNHVLTTLNEQYQRIRTLTDEYIILWFDACLFDQSMLAHIINCLRLCGKTAELLCIDSFPGITPYNGIGQLTPEQFASVYDKRIPITEEQYRFAETADNAFAMQRTNVFRVLADMCDAPLPWMPAAVRRWMLERPSTGLGRLEHLALEAIRAGCSTPDTVYRYVADHDVPPQFWGDTALWAKINGLACRDTPLIKIEGPNGRLPQWDAAGKMELYRISAAI